MDIENARKRHRVTLYRDRKRAAGICLHCLRPVEWEDGIFRTLCPTHMRKQVEYNNRWKEKKGGKKGTGSCN